MAGAILVLFLAMTLFDDDFVKLVHVWSIILIVGFLMKASSAAIPDDNVVFIPEVMMKRILSHIHYLPRKYEGKVHTSEVRDDFSQLFQYKFVFIIEEVIAAISTPFILFFCLRHRAEDIVKFIHNFTVDVEGIGHVCSFAQMDLKKHGSAFWQPDAPESGETRPVPNYKPDDGRTELSLLHFTCNNPDWKPPKSGTAFITKVQGRAGAAAPQQLSTLYDTTGLSLDSLNLTVCERRLAEMRSNSVMGQQLSTSNQVQRSTDESVVPFDPALHGSIGSGMLSPNLLQASSMHQSSVGIQNSTFFALGAAMDADTSINSLTKIQRYQAAQDLGASCLYLRELNNQRQRISRGQVNMVTHQQPSTQYQDMRDDREVQSVFRHPLATNTNYGQDRLIPRSPSPPAVDPFQDAYMSNIVSTQPENVGSQYQSMLYSASTQIQQREQQQRDLEQQHQAAGSAFSDDNHFLHPSQR
uniref:Autophagy-related protein 9 n=1 Tax=Hirondellea gigas TaxID=1518452 RepID=A0A6A7FR36_9CRUS